MGMVEIYGAARPRGKLMKSPLSKKNCVYYKYVVEEKRSSGKSSYWATIASGNKTPPFYIEDKTGKVLVDPKKAFIEIPLDLVAKSSTFRDPPEKIKRYLTAAGLKYENFLGLNKTMRFNEWIIKPGDKLYVMGVAGDNPYVKEATAQKGVEDVMIQKGDRFDFYYISNKHEKDILNKYTWKVIGGLGGGAFLILVSLATMVVSFLSPS